MFSEDTKFVTLDLPDGREWAWYPDLNVVGLSSRLDCAGKLRAVDEMHKQWRRAHLSLVETA